MSWVLGELDRISPIKAYREAGKLNSLIQMLSRRGVPFKELKTVEYHPAIGRSYVKAISFIVGLAITMELLKGSPYIDLVHLLAVTGYALDYLRSQYTHIRKVKSDV